jgi:hypothetical protein
VATTTAASTAAAAYPAGAGSSADATPAPSQTLQISIQEVSKFDEVAWSQAFKAYTSRGKDLEDIAKALVGSMVDLMRERPDLAKARFDFVADNGKIRVVSAQLNAHDRAWLEQKLNSNTALKPAVQQFHDDAVATFALTRKANGHPLDETQLKAVGKSVDGMYRFMDLLENVADGIRKDYRPDPGFYYRDASGAKLTFDPDPLNATGLLHFVKRIQSLESGPLTTVMRKSGHTYAVRFNDPFALASWRIKPYDPDEAPASLGLDVRA